MENLCALPNSAKNPRDARHENLPKVAHEAVLWTFPPRTDHRRKARRYVRWTGTHNRIDSRD